MSETPGTLQAERNDRWSQKIWREWTEKYNKENPRHPCPSNILQTASSPIELQPWLIKFITSFQREQTMAYKPKTFYALLCHLHRHVKLYNPHHDSLRFLDKRNEEFKDFRDCMDQVYRQMGEIGIQRRHYDMFTEDDMETLWAKQILGSQSPLQLLQTIYFYNGKNLLLRRGEHQDLRFSQFQRLKSPDCYEYEHINVDESSGSNPPLTRKCRKRKITHIMADPSAGQRCHVFLLDTYLSKIPPSALQRDHFYLQPLKKPILSLDGLKQIWYAERSFGKNSLDKITKHIAENGGLLGHFTATSLQQTGRANACSNVTRMFKSNSVTHSSNRRICTRSSLATQVEQSNISSDYSLPDSPKQTAMLDFPGNLHFSGANITIVTEQQDSCYTDYNEIHMKNCDISIKPVEPIQVDMARTLQRLNKTHWQVVMMPEKSPSLQPSHATCNDTGNIRDNMDIMYSSDDNDGSYHSTEQLTTETTIFQYVK
jgi:hypothetical protein